MTSDGQRILIAFDGSDASIRAIQKTAELMGAHRKVIIFTAWEANLTAPNVIVVAGGLDPVAPAPNGEKVKQGINASKVHAQQVADSGVEIAAKYGLEASSQIASSSDPTAASIINAITNNKVCLLVVGSHRHGALSSIFLGSTTQTLLHQVVTPMLVIRPDEK